MKWISDFNRRSIIICILFLGSLGTGCEESWPGLNYDMFNGTKAEKLAKSVKKENITEIENQILYENVPVNYQEPRLGQTLLKVAILTEKRKSIEKILELGADPNLKDNNGQSPFHFACEGYPLGITDIDLIDLLIKYEADLNAPQTYIHQNGTYFKTPLSLSIDISDRAARDSLFYHLIKEGADFNQFGPDSLSSAMHTAALHSRMDLLRFLVIDKHCKIPKIFNIVGKGTTTQKEETIIEFLKRQKFKSGTINDVIRKEIVDYLIKKGF